VISLKVIFASKATELIESSVEKDLSYQAYPSERWRRLRTNTPLGPSSL